MRSRGWIKPDADGKWVYALVWALDQKTKDLIDDNYPDGPFFELTWSP